MEEKLIKKTFPSVSVIRCAQEGDYESLRMALESGANVNTLDPLTTDSPLMIACRKGFTQVIHLCLEFGAKNDPHPDYGQTALHAAVSCNQYESAKVLLDVAAESDADLLISNLTDPAGQTPLYLAALKGSESMLQLLLNHGAEMNCVDSYGQTCLHLCASSGNKKCMAFILDHGGDILLESRDTNGNTPLHFAAYSGHLDCVRLLLESAADVNQRNNSGQTPYTIASLRGHHQIGLLLLEYKDHHNSVSQNSSRPQSASTMNSISKPKNTGLLLPPRTPVLNRDESDEDKDDQYYTIPIKDYSQSIPSVYANNNNSPLPIPKFQRSLSDTLTLPRPHTLSSPVQSNGNRNRTFSSGKNSPVVSMLSPTVPYSVRSSREGSFKGIATPVGSKSYETERDFVDSPVANGILHNVPAVMSQYQQYSHR